MQRFKASLIMGKWEDNPESLVRCDEGEYVLYDDAKELERYKAAFMWLEENPYYSVKGEVDCINLEGLYTSSDYKGETLLECVEKAMSDE